MKRASILLALSFLFIYGCSKETETTIDSSNENLNQVIFTRGHGGEHGNNGGGGGGGNNGGGGNGGNTPLFDVILVAPHPDDNFFPVKEMLLTLTGDDFCVGTTVQSILSITFQQTPTCIRITPTPIPGEIAVELSDQPFLAVKTHQGNIIQVKFSIQDVIGPDGIQYSTDKTTIDPPVEIELIEFTVQVRKDFINVYRHSGHLAGRKTLIGYISIGDLVYTPSPPQ